MPQLYEKLTNIGLNKNEAQTYLATLELGEATVQDIALRAGINRVTAHKIIERLAEKELVYETKKGKKRFIVAQTPQKLIDSFLDKKKRIERQTHDLTELLPELATIYNYSATKPRIRFYEGLDGLKQVYQDTLINTNEIHAFLSVSTIDNRLRNWLRDEYIHERIKKNIRAYTLVPADHEGSAYQKRDQKQLRETRLLSAKKFPFSIEIDIYTNRVALISNKTEELFGVIIQSEEVHKTMKFIFDLSWQAADVYNKKQKPEYS